MPGYDNTHIPLTVVEKLWGQVLADAERIAVESEAGTLSYRQLWDRSVTIGSALRDHGVTTDSIVGILTESTLELEVAVWAVLQSGGAYLPLSPEYPTERLRYMIADSTAVAILTTRALARDARATCGADVTILCVEDFPAGDGSSVDEIPTAIDPSDLAYMIYTSGSTGKPKGVMIEHRSIGNQMGWMRDKMGIDGTDRVLQKTPFSFDAAQWEILAVAIGATVTMAGVGDYRDPGKLIATAKEYGVTTIQCVPTLWAALVETDGFADLTLSQLFSGGEVLTTQLARELTTAHPGARTVNLYGPTETTINVTAHVVAEDDLGGDNRVVPIGSAVSSTELLVLDHDLEPVSAGEIGELCVAGIQLARGYAGQPQQTAEGFPHLLDASGALRRIYRTGDLARRGPSGTVSFIGRRDNQVKVNGHRIELDEVRLAVESHRWIRQAVVVPWTTRAGGVQLAAFIELDKKEAALMDQGAHDGHHQSKVSKVAVLAQLSDDGMRSADELVDRTVIELPHHDASEVDIDSAFERKTYRTFHGDIDSSRIVEAIRTAVGPIRREVPLAPATSNREMLGIVLRWFGPFASPERLLPKYAYASPGALNANQIYLELAGVAGIETGIYYFHPLNHQLVRVAPCAAGEPRIRLHLIGKRARIEEVYSTNVDEVLHLEAGHMLGLLDEVAALHDMSVTDASDAPLPLIDVLSQDGYIRSACVDLVAGGIGYVA
ncbi:amino acid adenylation domain-containing protein, partial [Cryobacterium sp. MLB-32]|uniref:amino acid adenylation domain-containing protein n=1 Tax=Cryobacterium sp. MLB-32 TaxID=1529318 RepID=UPI0012E011C3